MKMLLTRYAAPVFRWLADFFEGAERRCVFCPDCGRNRWYGRPCK